MCNWLFANWDGLTLRYVFHWRFFSFPKEWISSHPQWELAWQHPSLHAFSSLLHLPMSLLVFPALLPNNIFAHQKIFVSVSASMRTQTKSSFEPIWSKGFSLLGFCNASNEFYLGWSLKWSYENIFLFVNFSPFMKVIPTHKFYYSLVHLYNKCCWVLSEHKVGLCYFGSKYLIILSFFLFI